MSVKKTYWKGISEKHNTPEFANAVSKEFQDDLPVDEFVGGEGVEQFKTGRRDFLKFMGFSVAAATLASCEAPIIKSIPYVNKPEDVTPGVANWYCSSFYDGVDFANVLVKTREGRPIWIKGLKDGFTSGGMTSRIAASILNLYNGSRLTGPYSKNEESNWETIDAEITSKLNDIASSGGVIKILSNTVVSPSTSNVIDLFKTAFGGNVDHIQYDAISYSGIRKANESSFGLPILPSYHFNKAKTIVSISSDFITNWIMPSKFAVDYGSRRKPENDWMSRHYQFESVLSLTGSNADYRAQIKPSQEGLLALALLRALKGQDLGADLGEKTIDLVIKAAKDLKSNQGESLVVSGSNNKQTQVLVNAINQELGNYGNTIDLSTPLNVFQGDDSRVEKLEKDVIEGKVDALLIYGSNPVYSLPNGKEFGDALGKLKLSVSFSEYADETSSKCNFICPDHNYLESWNDFMPVAGHYSIQQPMIRPLYNTRQAQESLMVWSGLASREDRESVSYHKSVKQQAALLGLDWNWSVHDGFAKVAVESPVLTSFSANVEEASIHVTKAALNTGEWEFTAFSNELGDGQYASNAWLQELPDAVTKVVWDNYFTMSPADCYKFFGINSDNQKSAWDGIHLAQEEPAFVASIKVNNSTFKLPIYPLPGQASGTIGIPFGYGRGENQENIGKSAFQVGEDGEYLIENGKKVPIGANAFKLSSFENGELVYSGLAELSLLDEKYPLACTQTHHTIMGRESIVKETTLDFFSDPHTKKEDYNPPHVLHSHAEGGHSEVKATEYSLWDEHPVEHVGHRWGMSIDLSSCNGCGVCIVACHTENNVPVVGKDEVRRSRDMHWLRMDRYFSSIEDDNRDAWEADRTTGDFSYDDLEVPEENPSVLFMPMLCQHCNHAPCETVCPVAATTHSNEGLNMMTYNRCIGTRYCGNNCPYKVRRFNWFNYRDYRKFKNINPPQDEMARLVLNPDVVVRSRGVMEKCSFCVQGIQEAKLKAKKEGRALVDSDVMCACGDACPNDCISFGDWNDKDSEIRKDSESDRAYQALEEVGVKPNIWYQLKVRNVDQQQELAANKDAHDKHDH
ncbi:MAG: molybdopterin oxidoreductase [Flavobacteriales bacterium]|nr:molybdopterin oxidoreductase [Flavobacteriales bacterium]